jgi:hypothetical protein
MLFCGGGGVGGNCVGGCLLFCGGLGGCGGQGGGCGGDRCGGFGRGLRAEVLAEADYEEKNFEVVCVICVIKGVQDVRFRNSTIRGAATYNSSIRHELSGVTGTPDINVRHCFLSGGVPIYNESGTYAYLRQTSAFGSLFDGGASFRASFVADTASVTVTTADVTLKGHEHCARYLTTTGVLTGNRNVIVPTDWEGLVYCNNTGAFTTTFKTSGGSGVVVAQTKRAHLMADGTNVVRITADV